VDISVYARHAIQYAAQISSVVKDLTYTLLHVQPAVSGFLLDEADKDLGAKQQLKRILRKNREEAEKILEKYKADMIRMGIAQDRIELATQAKSLGLAKDVLDRAQEGLYDAVAVGRRGLTKTQRAFMGSLTADLVVHSKVIPVWVVDGEVTSNKIMVAVDGSESSLRAVDYVAFMLGENPDIAVTLFHVLPRLRDYCVIDFEETEADMGQVVAQGAQKCIDDFYVQARDKFREAGIQEDQIQVRVSKRTANVGKAIADEAKKGDYGTVVVGRRGMNRSFFMGSVSRHVLDKTANRTVWVVN
jgi:nucleotide-binding universal stress UspA family protein